MRRHLTLITRAIIIWPPVFMFQMFLFLCQAFMLLLCIPPQCQQIRFFWQRYEGVMDALPIFLHVIGLWLCAVIIYGFFRAMIAACKLYKLVAYKV